MKDWRSLLKDDPTGWLLDGDDPSLRYRVLTELLGASPKSGEAREARSALMGAGPVAKLLSHQQPEGHWGRVEDFYMRSKYKGTVWNVILLSELAADPDDERVRRAGDIILRWSRRADGGFTYAGGPEGGRKPSLPCLSGNMVSSLVRLGFGHDPRMTASYEHLTALASTMTYDDVYKKCWQCRSGAVKVLKGLIDMPDRNEGARKAKRRLARTIAGRCLPGEGAAGPRPEWRGFGFPLMWNTDLIEIIDLLARSGERDIWMQEGLDAVLAKQDAQGRWSMERSFTGRHLVSFGRAGKPSRWTTFRALLMLSRLPD